MKLQNLLLSFGLTYLSAVFLYIVITSTQTSCNCVMLHTNRYGELWSDILSMGILLAFGAYSSIKAIRGD